MHDAIYYLDIAASIFLLLLIAKAMEQIWQSKEEGFSPIDTVTLIRGCDTCITLHSSATRPGVMTAIDRVLQEHCLDTKEGTFRWCREAASETLGRYALHFVSSEHSLGFRRRCNNKLALTITEILDEPDYSLNLYWQVQRFKADFLCQRIIKETVIAIRTALDEFCESALPS